MKGKKARHTNCKGIRTYNLAIRKLECCHLTISTCATKSISYEVITKVNTGNMNQFIVISIDVLLVNTLHIHHSGGAQTYYTVY